MASKSYRKFMATGLSAAVVASVVAPVAGAASFSDVKPGAWYEGAVNYVTENGYMNGTDKGFEPMKPLTRAEAAGIFANRFDLYDTNLEADFSDVKDGAWYHNAVAAVSENGIMGSTGNDMFSPDRKITRGEMAALIVRAYGFEVEGEVEHTFTDIEGNMFENDIATLVAWGITNGKTDELFAPGDTVSRAEMAAFIQKADEAVAPIPGPVVESVKAIDATSVEVTLEGTYTQEEVDAMIAAGYELTVVAGDDVHEVGKVTVKAAEASASADTTTLVLSEISPELPAGVELSLAVNGEVVEGTEFKYEAPATPEVTSVSAITKTGVDVVLPKVEVAQEDFVIEVLDPTGKMVEVKPVNLEIGDSEITFEFKTALTEVALGTWTVGGVSFDASAQAAVQTVNASTNEVELLNALKSSYFVNVNADFITSYDALLDGTQTTVKEIQDIINKVNSESATAEEKAAAVKAVNDATNQVQLLSALQNKVFSRVNASWIAEYQTAINTAVATAKDEVTEIQALVDGVDSTKVTAAVNDALDELSTSKNSTARSLVEAYIPADTTGVTVKAGFLSSLTLHDAVVTVSLANTNAKLDNALKTLASLSDDIDLTTVNSLELSRYRTAIAGALVGDKDSAADIQTLIDNSNVAAEAAAAVALSTVTADTTTSSLKTLLTTLANRSSFVADAFDGDNINDQLLEDYRAALVLETTVTNKDDASEINGIVVTVNNPKVALDKIDGLVAPTSTDLLTDLKDKTLNFKNLVDANKDAYLAELTDIQTAINTTDATTTAASLSAVKKIVDAANAKVALNTATTAALAKDALTNLALATDNTTYLNLSSTAKLEVADLILADIKANGAKTNVAAVTTAITNQNTARTTLISNVNAATTIVATDTALEALGYAAYSDLSASKQVEVAEEFLAAFPVDKDGVRVNYTTVTAIKTAVDAAIVAAN